MSLLLIIFSVFSDLFLLETSSLSWTYLDSSNSYFLAKYLISLAWVLIKLSISCMIFAFVSFYTSDIFFRSNINSWVFINSIPMIVSTFVDPYLIVVIWEISITNQIAHQHSNYDPRYSSPLTKTPSKCVRASTLIHSNYRWSIRSDLRSSIAVFRKSPFFIEVR